MSSTTVGFFTGKYREDTYNTIANDNEHPFWVSEFGKTYADPRYHQIRPKSDVGCMEYIISGTGIINVSNKTYIVHAGDTYLLPQGLDVNYYSDFNDPMEKIWFNFKGPLAEQIIKSYSVYNTHVFRGVDTSNMILRMHKAARCSGVPEKVQDATCKIFLDTMMFLSKQKPSINIENLSLPEKVRIYIDQHLTENLTVNDLANVFERSRVYISSSFKKAYDIAPHQYVIQSKIKMAAAILAAAKKPTRVVSEMVGFADEKDFIKHFKAEYGISPARYRDQRIQEALKTQQQLKKEFEEQ